ncbi:Lipoma-preferred partner -like protein, partial [Sarcoptes scabiei]
DSVLIFLILPIPMLFSSLFFFEFGNREKKFTAKIFITNIYDTIFESSTVAPKDSFQSKLISNGSLNQDQRLINSINPHLLHQNPVKKSNTNIYSNVNRFRSNESNNLNDSKSIVFNKSLSNRPNFHPSKQTSQNHSQSSFAAPQPPCSLPNIKNYLRLSRSSNTKQAQEVDHLTNLLVKSMEDSVEPDFFGMCNKCGEKVIGEGSGCTAMEQVYHIQCFTCYVCNKELRGKPFYAMESNPHCEECYLDTLEKCSVCVKPILDRILRATGKPYHPNCFTCIVCQKCLDGIPFTVDASNQIHCIDCFHGKFAPRCSVCSNPIVPEPGKTETVRVVAMDKSFHVSCYKCEDCDLLLSSEVEGRGCYPLDNHILCRGCNAKRVQAITAN